jgi:ribose 5-phosphate isomerase A
MVSVDENHEKHMAAEAAADLVTDGMVVGLGTGSTVAYLLAALSRRNRAISCVATSAATEELAVGHGLRIRPFKEIEHLDLAVDGADQVDPRCWLIKGGGGAHTRERIVATAADRFVVIVSSNKLVVRLQTPVPLELLEFGLDATLAKLPGVSLRSAPHTPDGGVLADFHGDVGDPDRLSARLNATPGVVDHGLFAPAMVSMVLIGRGDEVEAREPVA